MNTLNHPALPHRQNRSRQFFRAVRKHRLHLAMILPVMCWYLLFRYGPLYGITLAFKDFQLLRGITGSPWVVLANYKRLFGSYDFKNVFTNTLVIAGLNFLFGFPAPILLALMLNELRAQKFKRVVQTVTYMPHFISLVVICSLIRMFTAENGLIVTILSVFGFEPVSLLSKSQYFVPVYVLSNIWQGFGWDSIIYLSALTAIDPGLYEAATIDGANRWKQTLHVTLPGISQTIIILLILRMGSIMSVGYEKIILLYNPGIYETSDVISTFVYRKGLEDFQWSYSTAVGVFNSVVNFLVVFLFNRLSRKVSDVSLW